MCIFFHVNLPEKVKLVLLLKLIIGITIYLHSCNTSMCKALHKNEKCVSYLRKCRARGAAQTIAMKNWTANDKKVVLLTLYWRGRKKTFVFVTYTIIQSITSSEMCSLHLTHPCTHTWSSGRTHTHTHLEQWTDTHTHLEQWAADAVASGEQSGVRCLAQGSHLSRGQFQPEPRFEPTTSGYKSDALSIRAPHWSTFEALWTVSNCLCQSLSNSIFLFKSNNFNRTICF